MPIDIIDFVAHSPNPDEVLLVMVQERAWGDSGLFLPALQAKLNTYLGYILEGRLFLGRTLCLARQTVKDA